jgi:hypothetical protein
MLPMNQDIDLTLIHERWCCKREFDSFLDYSAKIIVGVDKTKKAKIAVFTAYGNFLRHLFSFYEGILIYKNPKLFKDYKTVKSRNERVNQLLGWEVDKLIRNKEAYYKRAGLNMRELAHLKKDKDLSLFGVHLRQMRNRFSHINEKRVGKQKDDITLSDFFFKYHHYILLLNATSATWDIKSEEEFNWAEIESFIQNIQRLK